MSSSAVPARNRNRRKRSTLLRFSLALLAVLGIGLGVTTAVWTDNVWFRAEVTTKTFNLQGSVTSATTGFLESETGDPASAIELVIPSTVWAGLEPGDVVPTTIWVKNAGTAAAVLDSPVIALTGTTAGLTLTDPATGLTVVASGYAGDAVLAAGAVIPVTVTITAGPNLVEGATGTLTIHVAGESQA